MPSTSRFWVGGSFWPIGKRKQQHLLQPLYFEKYSFCIEFTQMHGSYFQMFYIGLGYDFVVESSAGLFRRNPAV